MAKHTLILEPDYDFVLTGISSHAKDYRICWALNNTLNIELKKTDSLEIKGKKQPTSSFFSTFKFEDTKNFTEYIVLSNFSEAKSHVLQENTLFKEEKDKLQSLENEFLIPEHKNLNYFFIVKGEISDGEINNFVKKLKELDIVLTTIIIDVPRLKSKNNLIF